jgi:23S rRNA pseudouridine1911/1915/1917 synthase
MIWIEERAFEPKRKVSIFRKKLRVMRKYLQICHVDKAALQNCKTRSTNLGQQIQVIGVTRVRLEEFLFQHFPNLSRMYIRDVIKAGNCEVNGRIENKGKRVSSGDFIEIEIDAERINSMRPQKLPLEIVFEDADLIVINKAPGMLVHPTHPEKSGTLLNAISFHLNNNSSNGHVRPGLIHRLDKETSGLMIIAKNVRAHRIIARQFQRKTVEKTYVALVNGTVEEDRGAIDAPIGRFVEEKRWDVKADGKEAVTNYAVIERFNDLTLLTLEPVTGRTNQLRIHCASVGHPIVGDVKRGGRKFERLCLHASKLIFQHPSTGERMVFESEVDFRRSI